MAGWISGWILFGRVNSRLIAQRDDRIPPTTITVVIPARNEAANIGPLLESLKAQTMQPLQIIVADDSSEDGTAFIARRAEAEVIAAGSLPAGWMGKNWACWSGAKAARGELLVFLDADIVLEPNALASIAAGVLTRGGLLSIQPYHRVTKLYEKFSAFFNIIVLASVGEGDIHSGAFGPCIACHREDYFRVGGHEAVRGKILDHYELGVVFSKGGSPIYNCSGKGIVNFRMYPDGFVSLVKGWGKSFALGAAATQPIVLLGTVLWIVGIVKTVTIWRSIAADLSVANIAIGVVIYAAFVLQLRVWFRRAGSFGLGTALLFPIPLLLFLLVFIYSIYQAYCRKQVRWKGRDLTVEEGDPKINGQTTY